MDDELRGVKGWLLTFVIIMAVVSPIWSTIQVYREFYTGDARFLPDVPMVSQLRTFAWTIVVADALIGWFVAYRLVAIHNWRSVQLAIAGIWLGSVGLAIVSYAALVAITGVSFGEVMAEVGPRGIIQPVIFGLIWTTYLLKSVRVENTIAAARTRRRSSNKPSARPGEGLDESHSPGDRATRLRGSQSAATRRT